MNAPARQGAVPLLRSTRLLIGLRLRRLSNAISAAGQKKKAGVQKRTGNPGKKSSKVVFYVFWPLMLLALGSMANNSLTNLHFALDEPGSFWRTVEFSHALVVGVTFLLSMLWVAAFLLTLAAGELSKPDWDLEWLVTLPIRADTLLWARILERSVVNPSGILMLLPACTVVAWYSGYHWSALAVGALAAWPLLLLAAVGRTLVDTGLRLSMRASQLRNLNAAISVTSIVVMYLAISMSLKGKSDFMMGVVRSMPDWLAYTPIGLTVRALNDREVAEAALHAFAAIAEIGALVWLGIQVLNVQLRNGVVAGGSRDTARTIKSRAAFPAAAPGRSDATQSNLFSAVQRRELTLLGRDRNFLVQSLVLPLLIVGGQVLLGSSGVATTMWKDPNVLASVAFGLAAYSMSMSAFQTLNTEGHALWLLYTFPRPIEDVLKDKAKMWGVLTLAYPTLLFGIGLVLAPTVGWKFAGAVLTAFLGIPIYAFIAVALGVFGSNPLEQQQNQKVKPAYVYLFMTLSALYIYAIVTPNLYQRLIFIVLTVLLAFALWQKARDQLPYLLDPDASPPARVSTSDGLIAAMLFFVAQAVATAIFVGNGRVTGAAILMAFSLAGCITYALMRSVYAKSKTRDVPRIFTPGANHALLGAGAGLGAAAFSFIYLIAMKSTGLLEDAARDNQNYEALGLWLLPLGVIAAPIFEEFIFRGLIFGGLRRSFGVATAALASAAIFAILHPPVAIVPVFVLGLCTALVYERSRSLLAPMLVHAVYNACVIGVPLYLN